jgi:ribosomal protein L11 methylase PrmA
LSKGLTDLVDPDGWLILSGLLAEQETEVLAAIVAADLTVRQRRQVKDWIALGVTR